MTTDRRRSAVMPKIVNSVPLHLCGCMCICPEQVQHAEWTSPQSSESTTDNSDGESLVPQDNAISLLQVLNLSV